MPDAHIQAINPYVATPVWTLVQLQYLNGARSGELVDLRPIDLDTTGPVWILHRQAHKTAHYGKIRRLAFGPRAQKILRPFMVGRPVAAFMFNPTEAMAEHAAKAPTHRRPHQKSNTKRTYRTLGVRYTVDSYRRAIEYGCSRAGVPRWTPHQLRHTHGTEVRRRWGLEVAQAALGHAMGSRVSELYAEENFSKVIDVAKKIG